ncbi:MAG: ribosome biogenesis GTP-binding protein YihA/YsxC [Gammaproteobacteria bacterium]|jgi:GTP-binding protein|nr:ribosome biogenesis GTP-binding protein YihA/YsxC [Gammaproteobacteria bacterium]
MNNQSINHYYRQARFLISAASPSQFPADESLEVAFAGRSNAGKSSAINTLCDNKGLAKISKTPGRTRLVNYFSLDDKRRLVDLPGYGFAKVPLAVKDEWQRLMGQYLEQKTLRGLVIIMDIRHPLKEFDLQMLDWCRHYGLPAHVLLTKADKLNRGGQQNTLLKSRKILKAEGYDASMQTFSSLKKAGLDELVHKLNDWLELE